MSQGHAAVPIVWLSAEKTAEDLITAGVGDVCRATFEFRATRDVLALTLFVAGVRPWSAQFPDEWLTALHEHLADAPGWQTWCRSGLARARRYADTGDLRLADGAWRWLVRARLLPGPPSPSPAGAHGAGAACRIGLLAARCVIRWHIVGRSR